MKKLVVVLSVLPFILGCGQAMLAAKMDGFQEGFESRLQAKTEVLPDGKIQTPYEAFVEATGGKLPYQFKVVEGVLPPGLEIEQSTGKISGTPTASGKFVVILEIADSSGNPHGRVIKSYSITITN